MVFRKLDPSHCPDKANHTAVTHRHRRLFAIVASTSRRAGGLLGDNNLGHGLCQCRRFGNPVGCNGEVKTPCGV